MVLRLLPNIILVAFSVLEVRAQSDFCTGFDRGFENYWNNRLEPQPPIPPCPVRNVSCYGSEYSCGREAGAEIAACMNHRQKQGLDTYCCTLEYVGFRTCEDEQNSGYVIKVSPREPPKDYFKDVRESLERMRASGHEFEPIDFRGQVNWISVGQDILMFSEQSWTAHFGDFWWSLDDGLDLRTGVVGVGSRTDQAAGNSLNSQLLVFLGPLGLRGNVSDYGSVGASVAFFVSAVSNAEAEVGTSWDVVYEHRVPFESGSFILHGGLRGSDEIQIWENNFFGPDTYLGQYRLFKPGPFVRFTFALGSGYRR